MSESRDLSELQLYGAKDFEELDGIYAAMEKALDCDRKFRGKQ